MNIYESKLLNKISHDGFSNQRQLSDETGFSLGLINKSLQSLKDSGLITSDYQLTKNAFSLINRSHPKNAVILAAGYGLRMVPINMDCPKGLLTVDGEHLIDRLIKQLKEKQINDITVVVGFMKEKYEYLIDTFGVKLVYNKDYSTKNNLHSLNCVVNKISNTYIIPCDIWCVKNPFSDTEFYSWYMLNELIDSNSTVRITRNQSIENIKKDQSGNKMIGISYISENDSKQLKDNIKKLCKDIANDNVFWEKALFDMGNIEVNANIMLSSEVTEINSYEQLRELDCSSKELENESLEVISKTLNCKNEDIKNIKTLKKGMTNRSFIFTVDSKKYIMRIPGEGTDKLINRKEEADVYNTIKGKNICDELFYINPDNGFKISSFVENSRVCDPYNFEDVSKCMKKLKHFHDMKLKVNHEFSIVKQIDFYESLWLEPKSIFDDYQQTKKNVLSLIPFVNKNKAESVLTHIDAVPDNFLFSKNGKTENIQLIDWEYAGMQDPHVDIAMFCIYSLYDSKEEIDKVIDLYFENNCDQKTRIKIYCYVALCGLLWSNWCEYKRQLGVEFGEYSLKQYRYAKDYFKIASKEIKELGE
ncbi:MAG: NTP transferase domain-containing protein [Treponema sp.]|nr:NTP transferase domain-containing protein [Treponema sp.]